MNITSFLKARRITIAASLLLSGIFCAQNASAAIIGVAGPNSSAGAAPTIIGAPAAVQNSNAFNSGQEGFNEAQGVVTTSAYTMDSGVLASGSLVDSHMIFLNKENGPGPNISHNNVVWTFSGLILGVMSNGNGSYEVASSGELGAAGTSYPGSTFRARGMEGGDSYAVAGNSITVNMVVAQPGDWIRVITRVPDNGSTLLLLGLSLAGFASIARRRK